jgi:hypothetical protein
VTIFLEISEAEKLIIAIRKSVVDSFVRFGSDHVPVDLLNAVSKSPFLLAEVICGVRYRPH